jgi:hypothetical protein
MLFRLCPLGNPLVDVVGVVGVTGVVLIIPPYFTSLYARVL